MAIGISLHIGLNHVDPSHYSGWQGKLVAAEYDAKDMYQIALSQGFQPTLLLSEDATRGAVISAISNAALNLSKDDLFFISYSGHGGQVPDLNHDDPDDLDETWCLFDGQIIDDELYNLWSTFIDGVRILVISDSCFSGGAIKLGGNSNRRNSKYIQKFMPYEIGSFTYTNHKNFYDNIQKGVKNFSPKSVLASVKLIAGCQEYQSAYDGRFNSLFTGKLKKIWDDGGFSGDYSLFFDRISSIMPSEQKPKYDNVGQLFQTFDIQRPFTI
jgi:metacaspase-1